MVDGYLFEVVVSKQKKFMSPMTILSTLFKFENKLSIRQGE